MSVICPVCLGNIDSPGVDLPQDRCTCGPKVVALIREKDAAIKRHDELVEIMQKTHNKNESIRRKLMELQAYTPIQKFNIGIIRQGAPIVNTNNVDIIRQGAGFIAVEIDMHTKWCFIDSTFSGSEGQLGFSISATDRSCHLQENTDKEDWTEVVIEDFKSSEWAIFTVDCCRYTVRLVLLQYPQVVKPELEDIRKIFNTSMDSAVDSVRRIFDIIHQPEGEL